MNRYHALGFTLFCSVLSVQTANAELLKGRPDVLVCSVAKSEIKDNWDQFVFYISGSRNDGSVLYKSLFSNPALITIDKDGHVTAPNLADCDQKTVDELYKTGRAASFNKYSGN